MASPAAVTFDDMRDLAAREASRLAIWEDVDGHKRRDREIHEAMIRMIDAVAADPVIVDRLKAVVRKQLKEAAAAAAAPLDKPAAAVTR